MAAKDREIAALTAELRVLEGCRAAGGEASGQQGPPGATERGPSSAEGSDDNALAAPDDRNFLRLGLQSQVSRLRQLAAIHNLHNTDPTGVAPSPHALLATPASRVPTCRILLSLLSILLFLEQSVLLACCCARLEVLYTGRDLLLGSMLSPAGMPI